MNCASCCIGVFITHIMKFLAQRLRCNAEEKLRDPGTRNRTLTFKVKHRKENDVSLDLRQRDV